MNVFWTALLLVAGLAPVCSAQQGASSVNGSVSDQSGAPIPGATVTITGSDNSARETKSNDHGRFTFQNLPLGAYVVQAEFPGLAQDGTVAIEIKGSPVTADIHLRVAASHQEVTVNETAIELSVDPAQQAATQVMHSDDLEALSDDPDELASDLQALAGPAAGPNGGQVFIDGFTAGDGTLPNKNAIREIRVNQNPFSPEFDTLGTGHIEILTKPGTDHLRGDVFFSYGNGVFNSRNPFAEEKAPFDLKDFGGSVSGRLNSKGSFFVDVDERRIENGAIINAITLDPSTLAIISPFTQVLVTPMTRLHTGARADYQLNAKNVLTLFYGLTKTDATNAGVGNFELPSRGYDYRLIEHAIRWAETMTIGNNAVNETRFQFLHQNSRQLPEDNDPAITVVNAFDGGGNSAGLHLYIHHHYEVQNYTTLTSGAHVWKFGARVRAVSIHDTSEQNFNGMYTFGGAYAPILDANNQPLAPGVTCDVNVPSVDCTTISSIEQYRRTLLFQQMGFSPQQVRALGGGASQFSINTGNPIVDPGGWDIAVYAGDDWKLRPNLTVSFGLRYETQANIGDRSDFAPRVGFAWAPHSGGKNGAPSVIIRGGFGIFYDRYSEQNVLIAERYNGINQQQFLLTNPDTYPALPTASLLEAAAGSQIVHTISSSLRAPMLMQSSIGVERQLPGKTTLAVNYINSHGLHELLTRNINAPLPGTYTGVAGSGVFPYPSEGPIYEMESAGLYNQNQLITTVNSKVTAKISLFGSYSFGYVRSNTDGLNTFPANQYSDAGEYGPAANDIRHRASISGSVTTIGGLLWSPFIILQSGVPFNIITSQDIYGDTVLDARPGIATNPDQPGVIATRYGLLDPNPAPGEPLVPRNFGRGPGLYSVNLRLARTFRFGPPHQNGNGGSDRRFGLTASVAARNLLNHVNPGPIVGDINSPLFGQPNQIAAGTGAFADGANNRRVEFQLRMAF
jgi:hypothetical protein